MANCYVIEVDRLVSYEDGLELQQKAFNFVKKTEIDGVLLLLQHKPVITVGASGGKDNLLIPRENLEALGIDFYESKRGGNITYHGPGQLVGYPIMKLEKFNKDVHWYLNQLEEVIIETLKIYGINAGRKLKYTGVWVENSKIAAIGVYVKRWITMHGFSFNISINKSHFALINPCGITEFGVASLNDYLLEIDYNHIINSIKKSFEEVFNTNLITAKFDMIEGE